MVMVYGQKMGNQSSRYLLARVISQLVSDGTGGAIIAWTDGRNADADIYVQKIDANGNTPVADNLVWQPDGVPICMATGQQAGPQLTPDGHGGAIVTWIDGRALNGIYDIAAQRVNQFGWVVPTGMESNPKLRMTLNQNFPNPFNPTTTISFVLPERLHVTLSIFDVGGRLVKTLQNETLPEGYQEVVWDSKDQRGAPVSSGIYFFRLRADDRTLTKKMVLLK